MKQLVQRAFNFNAGPSALPFSVLEKVQDVIDSSNGFYAGHAEPESRSLMNITFRLQSEELEKKFLAEAKKEGFVGLNGHRSVGGCRASTYNAVPYETCKALSEFMVEFQRING